MKIICNLQRQICLRFYSILPMWMWLDWFKDLKLKILYFLPKSKSRLNENKLCIFNKFQIQLYIYRWIFISPFKIYFPQKVKGNTCMIESTFNFLIYVWLYGRNGSGWKLWMTHTLQLYCKPRVCKDFTNTIPLVSLLRNKCEHVAQFL